MTLTSPHPLRIGIDLGGTKISGIALDLQGNVLWHNRVDTPVDDYEGTVSAIAQLVVSIEQALGQAATVGIATPGSVSKQTGLMKGCNSTCLNGKPLQKDLEAYLKRSVRLANDADCMALSESVDGAAAGAPLVFGVILGTGTGGGLVVNQQLVSGPNGITGEWGHNTMPVSVTQKYPPRPCYCGKVNCVENFLQGKGLEVTSNLLLQRPLNPKNLNTLAERHNPDALRLLDEYAQHVAVALSFVINILDPGVIVLGGGLSNLKAIYPLIPEYLKPWVFSDTVYNKIVPAKFGDDSGVRGAAWLWN